MFLCIIDHIILSFMVSLCFVSVYLYVHSVVMGSYSFVHTFLCQKSRNTQSQHTNMENKDRMITIIIVLKLHKSYS
jgi:hypothetical protein